MDVDYVIFASYGNDSVALIQWFAESGKGGVHVLYSDTGWASPDWAGRVERGEALARSHGFVPHRTSSEGLVALARRKKAWPRNGMQFCTQELKIAPAQRWLNSVDPGKSAVCAVGVRREESRGRSTFPRWTEDSDAHGGRSLLAPLATTLAAERDALIGRAGFDVLPHRSKECWPCVNANRADLRTLTEGRIAEIAEIEESMGHTSKGKPRTMFRPYRHQGATGIREVCRWAAANRGGYEPPSGCDGGVCGG